MRRQCGRRRYCRPISRVSRFACRKSLSETAADKAFDKEKDAFDVKEHGTHRRVRRQGDRAPDGRRVAPAARRCMGFATAISTLSMQVSIG